MDDPDFQIRLAAFTAVDRMVAVHGMALPWSVIEDGFTFRGQSVKLSTRACGIFRPKQMQAGALSVKRVVPRAGRTARYDDQVADDAACFTYNLQDDPNGFDNAILLEAHRLRSPIIYLYGIAPSTYVPLFPSFIIDVDRHQGSCTIAVDSPRLQVIPAPENENPALLEARRAYLTRESKVRLHQAAFRQLVLKAYDLRCTVCRLPQVELLEAAHIIPDRDERGRPEVPNGLSLCRLHHGAFDKAILGVRPDGLVEISRKVMGEHDGDVLERGIKAFNGRSITWPKRFEQRPREEYLDERYAEFLARQRAA